MGTFTQTDTTFIVTWAVDELDSSMWKALRSAVETHLGLPSGHEATMLPPLGAFAQVTYAVDDSRRAILEPLRLLLEGSGWLSRLDEAAAGLGRALEAFPLRANATGVNCHFAGPVPPGLAGDLTPVGSRFAGLVGEGGTVLVLKTIRPYLDGRLASELRLPERPGGGMVIRMNCHADHDGSAAALARLARYAEIARALADLAGRLYGNDEVDAL
jgi:hypothetical protein